MPGEAATLTLGIGICGGFVFLVLVFFVLVFAYLCAKTEAVKDALGACVLILGLILVLACVPTVIGVGIPRIVEPSYYCGEDK